MAEEEYEALEADFLKLTQLTSNTTLSVTEPFEDDELNPHISLLAISNKYGFLIIGSQEGFIYISIKDCIQQLTSEEAKKSDVNSVKLQNQINIKINESKVQQIVLSEDQLTAFIVLNNNKVLLYNISQLNKEKENTKSFKEYSYDSTIKLIQTNPKNNDKFAILLDNNELKIENFKDNSSNVLSTDSTSMIWSLDGEFIFSGNSQGTIEKLSMTKEKKQTIELPESLADYKVASVYCQSNDVLAALYLNSEEEMVSTCIFSGVENNNIKIIKCEDPCYGNFDKEQHFIANTLSQISKKYPNIICFGSTTSPDIGVIGDNNGEWSNWVLPDSNQVSVPLGDNDEDCYPYGIVVDYTSDIKLPGDTPDEPAKEPVPILWIFDSYGRLTGFHCVISGETEKSALMTTPIAVPQYTGAAIPTIPETPKTTGFGSSLASGKPAFGNTSGFSFGSAMKDNQPKYTGFGFGAQKTEEKSSGFDISNVSTIEKPKSSGFAFMKASNDEKPKPSGFSFANTTSDEKPKPSGFSFVNTTNDEKPKPSGFSFNNTTNNEKPKSSGFSFANTTNDEKPKPSGFSFTNTTNDEKPKPSGFSFTNTNDEKSKSSGFSFANTSNNEKPKSSGFSFANTTNDEKPKSSGFSFANTTNDEKPKSSGFSFSTSTSTKTEDKSFSSSTFSFTQKDNEKPKTTGFSLSTASSSTKTEEKPKQASGFSFLNSSSTTNKTENTNSSIFGSVKSSTVPQQPISFSFNKSKEETKTPTSSLFGSASSTPKLGGFSFNKSTPEPPKIESKKNTPIAVAPKPATTPIAVKPIVSKPIVKETKTEVKVKPPSSTNFNHRFVESFNNNYLLFDDEIKKFKEKINTTIENITNVETKTSSELSGTDLAECSLNNSDTISNEIKDLQEEVDDINKQTISINEKRLNILTELVKVEAKKTEIFKLLNSIKNNTYKKANMELGLGPEIEEAQSNIRTKVFKVENDIKDISEIIINIRKKLNKKADLIMEVPDLDKIYRSILYITQHTIKISNSLRNYDIEIRKYQNESILKEKPLFLNVSKQTTNLDDPEKSSLYDNLLKSVNKDETKNTEREQKTSQKIQFKKLLKSVLTSGRTTLYNDNVREINPVSIFRKEDEDEDEDSITEDDVANGEYYDTNEYDSNEYDNAENEYDQYLEGEEEEEYEEEEYVDEEEYVEEDDDEDGDIIDGENDDDDDDDDDVKPSGLSLFSKKAPEKPNFNINFNNNKKFEIKPFGSSTSTKTFTIPPAPTSGFNYAAAGMKVPTEPEGTWECEVCMVKNKPDAKQCIACETDKPGTEKEDDKNDKKSSFTFGGSSKIGISFGGNSSSSSSAFDTSKFPSFGGFTKKSESTATTSNTSTPSSKVQTSFNYAAAGMKVPTEPEGTWECEVCMVKNKPDATQCIACETDKPGTEKEDDKKGKKPSVTFGNANKIGISFGANSSASFTSDTTKFPSFGGFTKETESTTTTSNTTTSSNAPTSFNYAAAGMKVPTEPEGTWECEVCMVKNKPDATQCAACEADKPGTEKSKEDTKSSFTFGGSNKANITFGGGSNKSNVTFGSGSTGFSFGTSTTKNQEATTTSTTTTTNSSTDAPTSFNYAAAGMKAPTEPEGTWECEVCMVKNKPDATQCIACETDKPGTEKSKEASKTSISFGGTSAVNVTFGKSSTEEKKPEEKEIPSSTSISTKPIVGFSFASSTSTSEKKEDTIEKSDSIEIENDNKEDSNDDDLDIDTATEKIGFLGGNTFGSNSTQKNETHNVFGVSTTKPISTSSTTSSIFKQTSTGGFGSFGTSSTSTTTASTSAFGSLTTTPAFGTSTSTTTASTSAFGSLTTTPAFGSSTTTTTASTSAFGTTTVPAFGTTTTPAFGVSAFGGMTSTPSFGQTTSFGSQSNTGAFGQSNAFSNKTSAFGQFGQNNSSNNVFGQTTSMSGSVMNSGFSAFSNNNKPSDTPVFGSSTQIGFGTTSMMGSTPGMTSAFSTPSTSGGNASGAFGMNTSSSFGSFAHNNNTVSFASFANSNNNNNSESIFGNGSSFDSSKSSFGFGNSGMKNSSSFTQYR